MRSSYYVELTDHIYLQPTIGLFLSRNLLTYIPEINSISYNVTYSMPFTLRMNYFKGNKQYYIGGTYWHQFEESYQNTWFAFLGLEYFLTEKLSVDGRLNYYASKRTTDDEGSFEYYNSNKSLNLSVGMNYWMGR